jgi:hypothetical protein
MNRRDFLKLAGATALSNKVQAEKTDAAHRELNHVLRDAFVFSREGIRQIYRAATPIIFNPKTASYGSGAIVYHEGKLALMTVRHMADFVQSENTQLFIPGVTNNRIGMGLVKEIPFLIKEDNEFKDGVAIRYFSRSGESLLEKAVNKGIITPLTLLKEKISQGSKLVSPRPDTAKTTWGVIEAISPEESYYFMHTTNGVACTGRSGTPFLYTNNGEIISNAIAGFVSGTFDTRNQTRDPAGIRKGEARCSSKILLSR